MYICLYVTIFFFQPGLSVTFQGSEYTFEGVLVAFLGDTPAANKGGGFKEGVSFALRKCRQCLATDPEIQTKVLF